MPEEQDLARPPLVGVGDRFPRYAPAACLEAGEAPKLNLLNAVVGERFST